MPHQVILSSAADLQRLSISGSHIQCVTLLQRHLQNSKQGSLLLVRPLVHSFCRHELFDWIHKVESQNYALQ